MPAHDEIQLTGMVISAQPAGDYNKRIVIVTGEAGKITAFARGARKPGSKFCGTTEPFCFGEFKLIRGKDAYTLIDANISRHFEELRVDYEATILGSYFMEIADYYSRENVEAYELLNLLYASFLALCSDRFDRRLVRAIYEIKALVIEGEFPGVPNDRVYDDTINYLIDRIVSSSIRELYSFSVGEETLLDLVHIGKLLVDRFMDKRFKSLDLLIN